MKCFLAKTTLTVSLFLPSLLFAGTSDGGGGVGVRCPTSSSDIGFEILDFHEIKLEVYGLPVNRLEFWRTRQHLKICRRQKREKLC